MPFPPHPIQRTCSKIILLLQRTNQRIASANAQLNFPIGPMRWIPAALDGAAAQKIPYARFPSLGNEKPISAARLHVRELVAQWRRTTGREEESIEGCPCSACEIAAACWQAALLRDPGERKEAGMTPNRLCFGHCMHAGPLRHGTTIGHRRRRRGSFLAWLCTSTTATQIAFRGARTSRALCICCAQLSLRAKVALAQTCPMLPMFRNGVPARGLDGAGAQWVSDTFACA